MIHERIMHLAAEDVIDSTGDIAVPTAGEICLKSEAPLTIGDVMSACKARGLDITEEDVGERIIAIDAAGMIDSMGNLEFPRWSEICLKPEEGGVTLTTSWNRNGNSRS